MNTLQLPEVMVAIAGAQNLAAVLRATADGIAACPNSALVRIWLREPYARCPVCSGSDAGAPGEALHLVTSAGGSRDPSADYARISGAFHVMRMGDRKIGRVAATGEALLIAGIRGDEEWIADHDWVEREAVRSMAAQPLVHGGQTLGVLALFDRGMLDDEAFRWLRIFADYAAVSIVKARAFEEVEALREQLELENSYLREEVTSALGIGDFVGESHGLQKVLRQVQLVASTDAAVLVTGESGTGKELVARAIHEQSPRAKRPLIKVNCGAVPEGLFESEFFGHVRGAFTGASADRQGRFELADRGTLLLDEIGEIPLPMQAKLLRVLQEQEFERVGDTRTRRVDVRIIAATNRNLRDEVDQGRFRQDLYYRLSVFPIEIPPLRERRGDVPGLILYFVRQAARRLNRPVPRVTQATLTHLAAREWPGNIRELQNLVERAVILWQGGPLQFPDAAAERSVERVRPAGEARLLTRSALRQLERDSVLEALRRADGRIFGPDGAAELLDVKPTTLVSKIRALGIDRRRR
ncbi:MAG: sigma 54-interacting transcriptional regulator [Vicinamibacterales bacterium]